MKSSEQRLAWARDYCHRLPLRSSRVRESILAFLAAQPLPVPFAAFIEAEGLRGQCDPATIYRTLTLFSDAQVVRQLRFQSKLSYYVLNMPGEFFHYFVCTCCGRLVELAMENQPFLCVDHLAADDDRPAESHGLILFGLCRRCHLSHEHRVPALKVVPRSVSRRGTCTSAPGVFQNSVSHTSAPRGE